MVEDDTVVLGSESSDSENDAEISEGKLVGGEEQIARSGGRFRQTTSISASMRKFRFLTEIRTCFSEWWNRPYTPAFEWTLNL